MQRHGEEQRGQDMGGQEQLGQSQQGQAGCEPCRELAYRALCDGNDAAWDLLLSHLWPIILRWLYGALPELTPTGAEAYGYQILARFRRACSQRADLAANFPTFPALLVLLHHCLRQVIPSRRR
jgi:hypothetical protein